MNWYQNSWLIIFVSAYFEWYAVAAWSVALGRIVLRRASRRELVLLLVFVACVVLEIFQTAGFNREGEFKRSLSRYFGSFGPFLWLWLAWALHALWTLRSRIGRIVARLAVVAFLAFVLVECNIRFFIDQYRHGPAFDAYMAGVLCAETIREDWQGPSRRACMHYSAGEYLTANLPAVFDTWGAAAWWAHGQSEGPCLGIYPYPPDYLMLNDYEGYRGTSSKYRAEDFVRLQKFESIENRWMLLKRIAK